MSEIEVEAKYPLSEPLEVWHDRLHRLGARGAAPVDQCDEYFSHPSRDFVASGEAFRLRTVGEHNALTYKGPLLDPATKSRHEIEIGLAGGSATAQRSREMLVALGFRSAGCVRKRRTVLELTWRGRRLTVALDRVAGLGDFLEIEIVTPESDWISSRDLLLSFAAELGLERCERRSYLELLCRSPGV